MGCGDSEYLDHLKERLPGFLDSVCGSHRVGLAIYNAGTDIFADDPLGLLGVSADGILQRDLFVVDELRRRGIPTVMVLGAYPEQTATAECAFARVDAGAESRTGNRR
jgi:histone deacetylase 11